MTKNALDALFAPHSIAVFGATDRPQAVGRVVMRNLLQGGFSGPLMPVNPHHLAVAGVLAYKDANELPITPDLAVIATPPETVPDLVEDLGRRGTRAAIILTAGLSDPSITQRLLASVERYGIRLLGPNCLGLLVPSIGLNASFAHRPSLEGSIAFVSQSGALCAAVLDWARSRGIGFSHFISIGDALDVDFGDIVSYLGQDQSTSAILLYIEQVRRRQDFMAAMRSVAKTKPILAIKSGRVAEGARAAASHTGALAGADAVYDAAFRRAGILRVKDFEEVFAAVETLARSRPLRGPRLAILTNGGGIGVMAVDDLISGGGILAQLSDETLAALDRILPVTWSRGNPIDIIGDAPPERYKAALDILAKAPEIDAILCMYVPTAISDSTQVAQAAIDSIRANPAANVLLCWMGEEAVAQAKQNFAQAGLPSYQTPHQAVQGFLHQVAYNANRALVMQTPQIEACDISPDCQTARAIIDGALAQGRKMLTEYEAKQVLIAYGIPTVKTGLAATPAEAGRLAQDIGGQIALKINSPDITHKSDVGGVALNLEGAAGVEEAARAMIDRVYRINPKARIEGFSVQQMARRPGAEEVIIGVSTDPIFGPIIMFGQGGVAVEVIADYAVGLPPLNDALAQELIAGTNLYRRLKGYRNRPPADLAAIRQALVRISRLAVDIPEITELDINPLFADAQGILAVDARIAIAPCAEPQKRLAIACDIS